MTINLSMPDINELKPRITVIGVGGAGGNAVNNMIKANLEGVDFVVTNTDAQALSQCMTERRIQLGATITHGLGAGSRPEIGRAAAEEAMDQIVEALDGSHMAFITAGMGGGTGTGAAPVIAQVAREQGILTVGVVTKPFQFEGATRMTIAEAGLEELQAYVDTLIVIPNQNLFRVANEKTTFADAFDMADEVLHAGVRGVTDLMIMPGLINLDFADVRAVMGEMGKAMMGTGEAEGEKRAIDAAEAAISNPLLDDVSMKGAKGVLINITGGPDMTLFEVDEAANRVRDEVDPQANIIFGSTFDEGLDGRMRVSVVATGIEAEASAGLRPPVSEFPDGRPRRAQHDEVPVALAAVGGTAVAIAASAEDGALSVGSMPSPVARAARGLAAAISGHAAPAARRVAQAGRLELDEPGRSAAPLPATEKAADESPREGTGDGPYIAPRPMEPSRRRAPLRQPEAFAEAAVANGGGAGVEKRKAANLLQRITRSGRGRQNEAEAGPAEEPKVEAAAPPAKPAAPAEPPEAVEADLIKPAPEEDLLDIPAFLRRQAN